MDECSMMRVETEREWKGKGGLTGEGGRTSNLIGGWDGSRIVGHRGGKGRGWESSMCDRSRSERE